MIHPNKLLGFLLKQQVVYVLFILFGITWLFTFHNRYIEADECILGEDGYSFLTEGIVRIKTMSGFQDWGTRFFPHHRFFTWYGAGVISVFGWSITWLKISILPWYGLFFYFLFKYFKLNDLSKEKFAIASFLIFTTPIILLKSFSFRPDVILMSEGMTILYFLSKFRREGKTPDLVWAGAFAGLGFLTHLNGVAFCIAGFLFLLFRKEYKALLPFTIAGAVIGGLYFLELLPGNNFQTFIDQLTNWPTVNHGENFIGSGPLSLVLGRIGKLLSEHQRFFWSDRVMGFSILFLLSLLLSFKQLKKNHGDVLLFILLLVLSLNVFGSHLAERYILFYYGPMATITALGFYYILESAPWKNALIILAIITHLAMSVMMIIDIERRSKDFPTLHAEILSHIEDKDSKIVVPYEMIYDELPNRDLYVYKTYEYLQEEMPDKTMSQTQLFKKADELGMDYIVINENLAEDKGRWFYNWQIDRNEYFEVFYQDDKSLILKNSNSDN